MVGVVCLFVVLCWGGFGSFVCFDTFVAGLGVDLWLFGCYCDLLLIVLCVCRPILLCVCFVLRVFWLCSFGVGGFHVVSLVFFVLFWCFGRFVCV